MEVLEFPLGLQVVLEVFYCECRIVWHSSGSDSNHCSLSDVAGLVAIWGWLEEDICL